MNAPKRSASPALGLRATILLSTILGSSIVGAAIFGAAVILRWSQ